MLKPQNKFINQIKPYILKNDIKELNQYIHSGGWFTENKINNTFENNFKKLTNSKFAVTFPNGTLTLFAILKTLNIGKGDKVIVPSYTMVASANAVLMTGADVVFCDINEENLCMCPVSLKANYTKKVKAIIYVTLNGRSGSINEIKKFCTKKNIRIIEDAAHSIGSFYQNKTHHGNIGIASSFSFSMPKIITTGQGGLVITKNYKLYKNLLQIKNFGRKSDGNDIYESIGYNFKFTDLQATLGNSQLKNILFRIKRKKSIYKRYIKNLKKIKDIEFKSFETYETPWFVDIYLDNPNKMQAFLKKNNIGTRKVYPALNKLKMFGSKKICKIAEKYTSRGLWLPSSIGLSNHEIDFICDVIIKFFKK